MRERTSGDPTRRDYKWYGNTRVCDEWLDFENFYTWAIDLDFLGKQLDKDLLGDGTLYSPDTCAFMMPTTNGFIREFKDESKRGVEQVGGSFYVNILNSVTGVKEYLGSYRNLEDARAAYVMRRGYIATLLADIETDNRVKEALIKRFYKDPDTLPLHVVLRVSEMVEKNNY
jgi:hypothetical protein